jgi:hypothetical protein
VEGEQRLKIQAPAGVLFRVDNLLALDVEAGAELELRDLRVQPAR